MPALSLRTLADKGIHGIRREDGNMCNVPPLALHEEEGFNLRDYNDPDTVAHIEQFATAYSEGRYVPPILVRIGDDNLVYVVEGHCRRRGLLLALKRKADIPFVKCTTIKANDAERTEIMLRSSEGLKFKPLEIAQGYLRLLRMNFSVAEIARRVGKSGSHVENMLMLATSNSDVQGLIRDGSVSATTAIEALREHGEKTGLVLQARKDKAQERGKARVTSSMLKEPKLPAKAVLRVVDHLARVAAALPPDALVRAATLPDDGQIDVPVALYRDLLGALEAVREGQAKRVRAPSPLFDELGEAELVAE